MFVDLQFYGISAPSGGAMTVRFASGLFRLWVVLSVLWFLGAGAYIVASYQNLPPHVMKSGQLMFDDLIPAYEHCWDYRTSDGRLVIAGISASKRWCK